MGYPNIKGFLAPCKGDIYHLLEFRSSGVQMNSRKTFNFAYSSLYSVIERTFGVWKVW